MKLKTLYILILICSMSFFSSAKQSGKNCDNRTCCNMSKPVTTKLARSKMAKEADFDLPPLQLLMFDLQKL